MFCKLELRKFHPTLLAQGYVTNFLIKSTDKPSHDKPITYFLIFHWVKSLNKATKCMIMNKKIKNKKHIKQLDERTDKDNKLTYTHSAAQAPSQSADKKHTSSTDRNGNSLSKEERKHLIGLSTKLSLSQNCIQSDSCTICCTNFYWVFAPKEKCTENSALYKMLEVPNQPMGEKWEN